MSLPHSSARRCPVEFFLPYCFRFLFCANVIAVARHVMICDLFDVYLRRFARFEVFDSSFYDLQDAIWIKSLSANTAKIVSYSYFTTDGSVTEIPLAMLRLRKQSTNNKSFSHFHFEIIWTDNERGSCCPIPVAYEQWEFLAFITKSILHCIHGK